MTAFNPADTINLVCSRTFFAVCRLSRAAIEPMKLAYFDCFSGISGDMTLGALIDAGCSADVLRSELQSLEVPGWELTTEKVWKNGMSATQVRVKTEDQQKHRPSARYSKF